ncbi:hypothetical protein ACVW1A_001325 [Bradyrhizobium sp. LB1.3]
MNSQAEEENAEYNDLLKQLGRTEEQDQRIAVHEAGHAICARLLGHAVGGVTVSPDSVRGSEGMCWGIGHAEAFAAVRGDASDVRKALAPMMPEAGEDRASFADVYASVYGHCTELLAGGAAESLFSQHGAAGVSDDLRQARELALLICKSEEAVETFIAHCDVAARDLLMPYGDVVIVLSTVLRIKRTLDGAEIDEIISDVQARKALAVEHRRRADWCARELSAKSFSSEL